MGAFLRGYVVCDGCGKVAQATAQVAKRHEFDLLWDLPEGWELFSRHSFYVSVYCSVACNKHSAVMGSPDQRGKRKAENPSFDPRTMAKIFELLEVGADKAPADTILAAIEAVLMAWRKKDSAS